jgi:RNA polymerase sigma-70 factor, ECF subfamily
MIATRRMGRVEGRGIKHLQSTGPSFDGCAPGEAGYAAPEAALVARARTGDAAAFEMLYRLHVGRIHGLCLRMTGRPDVAEDCTQDAFIRAWRSLERFEGRSAFGTWLHRIAVNEVLGRARRRGPFLESVDGLAPADVPQSDDDAESDAAVVFDLETAIASLPEGARHVLVLQAIYGYSHEETADMLGVAVGTCKAQLHRARRLLKSRITPPGVDP